MTPENWKLVVQAKVELGDLSNATEYLKKLFQEEKDSDIQIEMLSRLVPLLVHQSNYREAFAMGKILERRLGYPRLPPLITVPFAYLVCVSTHLKKNFLSSALKSALRKLIAKLYGPQKWDAAYAVLWGVYWQDINLALQYNLISYLLADSQEEELRSAGFLAYTLTFKGHPFIGLSAMRKTITQLRSLALLTTLKDMYVFLAVALQMSSRPAECYKVYAEFDENFPDAPPFTKIICSASRLNVAFSELGPVEANDEMERCFAISFALKQNRNHIQIYGAKAALLALEGRKEEALIYLEKAHAVTCRNANTLDWLIYHRIAAAAALNMGDLVRGHRELMHGKQFLREYGSPTWYHQELNRIAAMLLLRQRTQGFYRTFISFKFFLQSFQYCNLHRISKALRIAKYLALDEGATYWSSKDCRDYLHDRLVVSRNEKDSLAALERQTLNLSLAFEKGQFESAEQIPTFDGLLAQVRTAYPSAKIIFGSNLAECLDKLRKTHTLAACNIINEDDSGLRVRCENGEFFIAVESIVTKEVANRTAIGVVLPTLDLGSQNTVEIGLRLLINNYVTLCSIWLSRMEHTKNAEKIAIANMASQVAHDIKSPLTLLNMISEVATELPEKTRILLKTAVNRIGDISNNLSTDRGAALRIPVVPQAEEVSSALRTKCLMPSLVETIVSEKRFEYRDRDGVSISSKMDFTSYGVFALVTASELRRVLSNLINNSMDALKGGGTICVHLTCEESLLKITVEDDGIGIPPDEISRLCKRGHTRGKPNGTGLGLFHARTTIESWGGELGLKSTENKGTTVEIRLARVRPPNWFLPALNLETIDQVVVLDDDDSIHGVWDQKLHDAQQEGKVGIKHFKKPEDLQAWVQSQLPSRTIYLFDYELIGSTQTGLDLIEKMSISSSAVLVTSHFENSAVLDRCEKLKVPLIPKVLAGWVPILLNEPEILVDAYPVRG